MKLKDLKATRKALKETIALAKKLDPETTVNMRSPTSCMYHLLFGARWSSSAVYNLFHLGDHTTDTHKLTGELTKAVENLFLDHYTTWKSTQSVSVEEWLLRAKHVLSLLNSFIAKLKLEKFQNR